MFTQGFLSYRTGKRRPASPRNRRGARTSLAVLVLAAAAVLPGCYTVPETGRSSLNLVPEEQLVNASEQQFVQLKQQERVVQTGQRARMVEEVGRRIVTAARQSDPRAAQVLPPPGEWDFALFANSQINAFAMPGGNVGVYEGMFNVTGDDPDKLAVVMGHEIAHVVARHGNERVSQQLGLTALGAALGVATGDMDSGTQRAILTAYGVGAGLGTLAYSRSHESEADYIGLLYMARAGYDPRAAIPFWDAMARQSQGQPPEFLSTHPSHETRTGRLQEAMPEALAAYRQVTGQ